MKEHVPRAGPRWAWVWAALWALSIYLVIPLARAIQAWVDAHLGRVFFLYAVYACLTAGVLAALYTIRRRVAMKGSQLAWLGVIAVAYALGAWSLRRNPEEAMHFVQYGVLSLLLFRAFLETHNDSGVYALAFFLGALLGAVDEIIQWITPRRFFDFRDMAINVGAVALMQLALGLAVRPPGLSPQPDVATLRRAWRFASVWMLLLLVLTAATPERIRAAPRWLGLYRIDEPLAEYGHRIQDSDGDVFLSLRTADELRVEDAARAIEAGASLAARAADCDYMDFLRDHPTSQDPFLHELRIHLFRRDRYWKLARTHRDEPTRHQELITISFREQLILERYFGATLRASGLTWPAELRERARQASHAGSYVSPVSGHLITRVHAWQIQGLLIIGLVAGWLAVRYAARRERM